MDYKNKYNEALERARELSKTITGANYEYIFPELKEGKSERIKKEIITYLSTVDDKELIPYESWIAWLEKQGEQGNNEDETILHRFSFYSYKDEPNILYLAGLYVNDEYRNKGIGTKILKIADEVAVSMKCSSILLKTEIGSNAERLYKNNGYSVFRREENQVWLEKQSWQKQEWNEEDENGLGDALWAIKQAKTIAKDENDMGNLWYAERWLKSLKDRIQSKQRKKKSEQKSANKIEPKFEVGDWIVQENIGVYKVIEVCECWYEVVDNRDKNYSIGFDKEYMLRLWTINDAKDGDVLATWAGAFIYNGNNGGGGCPGCYCGINTLGNFQTGAETHWTGKTVSPATKEQRDRLFKRMEENGYEWDNEKKQLITVNHFVDNNDMVEPNFHVGDKIIEKDFDECGCGTIIDIKDGKYIFDDGKFIWIKEQGLWEVVEQIEPKFKDGDWIVYKNGVWKVCNISLQNYYELLKINNEVSTRLIKDVDENAHLWTINDAKPGDIIYAESKFNTFDFIAIFSEIKNKNSWEYCSVDSDDYSDDLDHWEFDDHKGFVALDRYNFYPATKKQRHLLYQKMKDAGYEWDAEKKELKDF